jgi:hypothetical protein
METRTWINGLISQGVLCKQYTDKANNCHSRFELFKLASDVNGVRYLCEMQLKGCGLPYEVIKFEFANFINGKCHVEHQTKLGYYSSEIFCGLRKNVIPSRSSIMTFLDCIAEVEVEPYSHLRIFADKNSKLSIRCPDTSVCKVEAWGAGISAPNNVVIINKA